MVADRPAHPVLLSIPHAGRCVPAALPALLRVPVDRLLPLEDRHVDLLAAGAAASGFATIGCETPRAWVDLNRGEDEIDPAMVAGGWPGAPVAAGAKVRGGLGLIPRRLAGIGELWRHPLDPADVARRIAEVHRPFHARIAASLDATVAAHGRAVLVDLHSMPPAAGADIVVGDLFGRSAGVETVATAIASLRAHGLGVALNRPYAGGHVLRRHGRPDTGVEAIQIEVSRTLYLADDLATADPAGVARMTAVVTALARALADARPQSIATE